MPSPFSSPAVSSAPSSYQTPSSYRTVDLGAVTGHPEQKQALLLKWANRHGLIAGATGTGKTVSLQVMAEGFSRAGVPVFVADVKGDLSGFCEPSQQEDFLLKRAKLIGLEGYAPETFPVAFWDVFGEKGHPVRATVSEIGPVLLARMLELNDTQEGVLNVAFRYADAHGLLLLDLKDLRALLIALHENASDISKEYGQVSKASVATIQRSLLRLEEQGATHFLGEPALDLSDFLRQDSSGRGFINVLAADRLMQSPRLYATFLLWLLGELFENLPEAGDRDRPKLVFFFDEAHLLFTDAPKSLLEKIEQVIRLIRSKGVGVYFVTQNPQDIPESVLGQLGHRLQHALRAFTPQQQKYIRSAATTYRPNPAFRVEEVITQLAVGEALVSVLEEKGDPSMVQRTLMAPPCSRLGPATPEGRQRAQQADGIGSVYDTPQDRDSAYERLSNRADARSSGPTESPPTSEPSQSSRPSGPPPSSPRAPAPSRREGVAEAAVKSLVRSVSSSVGRTLVREILRGVLGGMTRR